MSASGDADARAELVGSEIIAAPDEQRRRDLAVGSGLLGAGEQELTSASRRESGPSGAGELVSQFASRGCAGRVGRRTPVRPGRILLLSPQLESGVG